VADEIRTFARERRYGAPTIERWLALAPPDGHALSAADWKEVTGSDAGWDRDRKMLLDVSAEFLTRVQALDEAGFSRRIVWYKGGWAQPLAMRIVRATTHDIYHAGQIMYLRALQGIPPR
jgi:uncharacterized damage-inducible protein DinB